MKGWIVALGDGENKALLAWSHCRAQGPSREGTAGVGSGESIIVSEAL